MQFSDQKVLVTGGSRGIGYAVSRAFAREGASVAMLFRQDRESAERALAALPGNGHCLIQADVADADAVESALSETVAALGGLDIVVNNAGIGRYHPLQDCSYQDWQQAWQDTLATNLLGPANICFCAARHMMEQGGGRIVNVSSRGAFRGEPDKPAYGASKAGLNALTQSLAVALAPQGIFVAAVAPGFVNTELAAEVLAGDQGDAIRGQSPFNRVAEPEEVAHAVLFLASQGAEFSTGAIIDVNGASYLRS